MGTKNVSLPPELEQYVDAKVESGEYAHASEVVREGLRIMMRQEAEKLEWLRNAIREGQKSAERGELVPGDQVVALVSKHGREWLAARRKAEAQRKAPPSG